MPKFDILTPLKRNNKLYQPGESVSFETDEKDQFQPLLDTNTIGVPGSYKESLNTMKTLEQKNKEQADAIFKLQNENTNLKTKLAEIASGKGLAKPKGEGDTKRGGSPK